MPTDDDVLFAEHVVKAGFLTKDEVDESLSVQKRMEEMGVHDSLRNVLVKRGALREGDAAIVARSAGLRAGGEPIPGYTLEARLGSGAMGSVYRAWQKGMKRHVAIKILRRDLTDDPRQVERLQREAALVGKLDHPNIVRGLDSGETDGLVWFVMELVDGETLRERMKRLGRLEPKEAIRITRLLAEALAHANGHGVVHRDVKPGNVLIAADGTPRLTDYGLAKGESDDALTQLDATLGTPQYISPEQARNPRDADIRSDIYSLGATLYAMLTGHPPFVGETMAATLTKVLYERPEPLSKEAPGTPPALEYVVERMMAKDRRHRHQTPAELLHDLRALEEGRLVVPSGFKGDIGEFVETRRHRRLWFAGAGLVAAAVALAAGVHAWESRSAAERRRTEGAHQLASLHELAGPRERWNGDTVQKMLTGLERIGRDFAGTPAAEEALDDVRHWAAQAAELRSVNELALRAGDPAVQFPAIVAEIEERLAETAGKADASVANRRLAALLADVKERRDRRAGADVDAAASAAASQPLDRAAREFAALAATLRTRYFGDAASALVRSAEETAGRFRDAAGRLDAHFAVFESAFGAGQPASQADFRALEASLQSCASSAAGDAAFASLLASLPPAGTRTGAAESRREALQSKLSAASSDAWERLRRDVQERKSRREYAAALAALSSFIPRALLPERDRAAAERDEITRLTEGADTGVRTAAEESARSFFVAIGRRDYAGAREVLDGLATLARSAPSSPNPAEELVEQGRRLLALVERLAWTPLRARLGVRGPLERGLSVRSGQGYIRHQGVHDVELQPLGREFTFASDSGTAIKSSLDDVALDDVLAYAGLTPSQPEPALVIAALKLCEYQPPQDAADGVRLLGEMNAAVDAARGAAEFAPLVARLVRLRDELVGTAQRQVEEAEERAERIHRSALAALDAGRYDDAYRLFADLLDVKAFYRSRYVRDMRDEIVRQRDRAAQGRQGANFSAKFPGAVFTRLEGGAAELLFDFEDELVQGPEGRKLLGLVLGRTEIASVPAVVADRPGMLRPEGAAGVPLVIEHVLAWRPHDAAAGPRDFQVGVECPFAMKSRISVSFLYRSERPLFLAVSIGGVTAGILSADGDRFGGRGVEIWNAKDLDRPDREFDRDERHRTSYLAKHPEALRKEGDRRFFAFEPGRTYRVQFVKDERKASLWVDGQMRCESDWKLVAGSLEGRIVLASYDACEVDDLRIAGILDPEWLRGR